MGESHKTIWVPEVLNVCDLGEWLNACQAHGVEHIPATPIGSCYPGEVARAIDGDKTAPMEHLKALGESVKSKDFGNDVLRWNLCAPESVKYSMGMHGSCPPDKRQDAMMLDDPRFFSILEDQGPFTLLTLYRRPWVEAMRHDGWPVEFRVFVEKHEIQGVSNYYPQISLPESFRGLAEAAAEATRPLLNCARSFTADWLVKPDGSPIYLEGGPPHTLNGGAHMCCFPVGQISGIALQPAENPEPERR